MGFIVLALCLLSLPRIKVAVLDLRPVRERLAHKKSAVHLVSYKIRSSNYHLMKAGDFTGMTFLAAEN